MTQPPSLARTRGDNLSEIIRQALNTYVKQHKGEE